MGEIHEGLYGDPLRIDPSLLISIEVPTYGLFTPLWKMLARLSRHYLSPFEFSDEL